MRSQAAPITFGKLDQFSPAGFTAERLEPVGRLTFRAPLLVLAETHREGSYSDWNAGAAACPHAMRRTLLDLSLRHARTLLTRCSLPLPPRHSGHPAALPLWQLEPVGLSYSALLPTATQSMQCR